MAAIIQQPLSKNSKGFHPVKIDMTPMVDLGFLLITFFIFTTSLAEPTVTKLAMPKADATTIVDVYEPTLLTALLDKGKVWVYGGGFKKAVAKNSVTKTDYNVQAGLGNFVRQKQQILQAEGLKDEMLVLIKPSPNASYQELMNALDEMLINGITRYAVVDPSPEEKAYLAARQ